MSTSTAMPPQAIANNWGIGTRQTGAGEVDDIKIDAGGWQAAPPGEWTLVSPKEKRQSKTPPPRPTSPKTSKWMPRPVQGPQLPTLAEKKVLAREKVEAARVAAFRASVSRIALPARETMLCAPTPSSPVSAPAPSKSRHPAAIKRIQGKRANSIKRSPAAQALSALRNAAVHAAVAPIRPVSKEEAAAAISPRSAPIVVSNPFAPLSEPRRGTGAVTVNDKPGTTHLENNAGRLLTVRLKGYEVVAVNFYGFFKSTLGSTFTPQSIGFHCAGDVMMVHLPEGLIETLGAYLVGKVPNMEAYLACQAYCRSLCRSIDFPNPKSMEDASIYAPYLAMTLRAGEREAIVRKLSGSVYTKTAMKCLKVGALAGAILSMPVATAATVAGAPLVVGGGLAFTACAAVTVGVALAVRSALHLFRPDERVKVCHAPLASVNSTAKAPAQHPDSVVRRLQLEKKAADAVRPDAARVTGIAVAGQAPTVFAKNQDNTVVALEKRSAALPALFHPADREEFCTWSLKHWKTIVGDFVKLNTPSEPDEWLEHVLAWIRDSNSSTAAKAMYERAARALHAQGITAHSELTLSQIHEWTKREVSVKNETVLKSSDKAPRQILAATPEFVVLTAPFIKQLTGLVRRSWKPTRKTIYAPGVGSKRLADAMTEEEWENMANLDFDGYDSCQGLQTAEMEIEICKRHGAPRAHLQLMRGNLETHGVSREGVKFTTPYCRNSGDPWTTLFNTTLNAFLMMYVYCRLHECDPRDARVKFFAGGDDGALFYQGPRIGFSAELARLGHPATVRHVDHLHEVEFLSCRLTHTSTGWNFIPMVGKTIAKLGYSVRASTPHKAKQIARGAAQSLYAASSGCPPLRAYLDAVLRVTTGAAAVAPQDEPWKMTAQHTGEPTAETWAHLGDIYGWSESLQDTLVARLATVKEAGSVIESPALEVLMDRDSGRSDYVFGRPADCDENEGWVKDLTTEGVEPNPGPTRGILGQVVQPRMARRPRQRNPRVVTVVTPVSVRGQQRRRMPRRTPGMAMRRVARGSLVGGPLGPNLYRPVQMSAAAAYATGQLTGQAQITQTTVNSTNIVHRELVSNVTGSILFTVGQTIAVQPGLPASFPWLSTQAVGWERYRFRRLRLCAYTRTGSTTIGSLILAPDYDAADPAPVSEQIASAYYGAVEDAPWKDICCEFDTESLGFERYIRTGALAANLDIKTYDVANMFVCTTDASGAVPWSKLWWEYDIDFFNPQLPAGGLADAGTVLGAGVFSAAVPFGSLPQFTGPLGVATSGTTVTFTGLTIGAEYVLTATFTGTVLTVVGSSFTGFTLKTAIAQIVNAAATIIVETFTLVATAASASITYANTATTITGSNLIIASLIPAPTF